MNLSLDDQLKLALAVGQEDAKNGLGVQKYL